MSTLLKPEEAAPLLRTTHHTLYVWRKAGKGPPYTRIGRKVYYEREVLDAWLAEQRSPPAKTAWPGATR